VRPSAENEVHQVQRERQRTLTVNVQRVEMNEREKSRVRQCREPQRKSSE